MCWFGRKTSRGISDYTSLYTYSYLFSMLIILLPPQGFPPEGEIRGGTLVTRAYVKESTYSWNIQSYSQYRKTSRFAWTGAARNRSVMMTFLLFEPASNFSTKWLGWRKTQKIPKERLTIGRFCDINCTVILRYSFALRVISDILWSMQLLWKLWTKRHHS